MYLKSKDTKKDGEYYTSITHTLYMILFKKIRIRNTKNYHFSAKTKNSIGLTRYENEEKSSSFSTLV